VRTPHWHDHGTALRADGADWAGRYSQVMASPSVNARLPPYACSMEATWALLATALALLWTLALVTWRSYAIGAQPIPQGAAPQADGPCAPVHGAA
jgi:hypothetical protein